MKYFSLKRAAACVAVAVFALTVMAQSGRDFANSGIAVADSEEMTQNKENISATKDKLAELEKKQAELDEQIAATKGDIEAEEENQAAIEEQIATVQETIYTLETSINQLAEDIVSAGESIVAKEKEIADKKQQIENGVVDFKQRLRTMYISGTSSYTDILIGSTDFYDMLMKIELVKRVASHDDHMIDELIDLKEQYEAEVLQLEQDKAQLEKSKADLEEQEAAHQKQREKLEQLFEESQAYLDKLAVDKESYESNLEEINQSHEEFEEELQQLYKEQEEIKKKEEEERKRKEEEERKRQEELKRQQLLAQQQAAQQQQTNNGNSQSGNASGVTGTQTTLDNADYNYTDKSQFTWPVPGYYHISYGVGWRWGAYHKGIDIYSPGIRGASICAAASGTVIKVSNTCVHDYAKNYSCGCGGGYGNYCIIDHGDGYWTLYGHSQHINVNVGDYVEKGQVLGKIGSTGHSTGDHLHFEIRLNGVALNPSNYV